MFYEDRRTSLVAFLPELIDRMTVFRGWLGHAWILWPLAALLALGVPAALGFVLLRALTAEHGSGAGRGPMVREDAPD
jgi:hypothetical protein